MRKALMFIALLAVLASLVAFCVVVAKADEPAMFTAHGMAVYHDKQYLGVKEVNWAVAVRDSSLIVYSKPVQKFTVVEYMPYDTAWTRSGIIGQWLCTDNDSILCVVAASVSEGKGYFWFIYKDYVFILGVSKGVPAQQPKKPTQQPEGNRV